MTNYTNTKNTKRIVMIIAIIALMLSITGCSGTQTNNTNIHMAVGETAFADAAYFTYKKAVENTIKVVVLEDKDSPNRVEFFDQEGNLDMKAYKEYVDSLAPNQKLVVNMTGWTDGPRTYCGRYPAVGTLIGISLCKNPSYYSIVVVTTDDPDKVGIYYINDAQPIGSDESD